MAERVIQGPLVDKLERVLQSTALQLCDGCRRHVPLNMAGGHGFDTHATPCLAAEVQALMHEIKAL